MTTLDPAIAAFLDHIDPPGWEPKNRPALGPHQKPPPGDWTLWILNGGRGAGKTEGGAQFYAKTMRRNPGWRGVIIAPTLGDAVESCVTGPSGLLAQDPEINWIPSAPGGSKLVWPNGSETLVIGTPTPREAERLRAAGNRHIYWWEEMAANPQLRTAWDIARAGLRQGTRPIQIGTTTPRPLPFFKELLKMKGTVSTHGTIFDNPGISDAVKQDLIEHYKGTRIGRQELYGELLEDIEGALWTREMLEQAVLTCPDPLPDLARIVVAIDPAVTSGEDADETGIVVAGRDTNGHGYILADYSGRYAVGEWERRVLKAYDQHDADLVVAEVNNGGDFIGHALRNHRPTIRYREVRATRGKLVRAEPVAGLYELGRMHHAGVFPELEDQMATWVPDLGQASPDRMDALVWAVTALDLTKDTRARTLKTKWR